MMNSLFVFLGVVVVLATAISIKSRKPFAIRTTIVSLIGLVLFGSAIMPAAIAGSVVKFTDKLDTFKTGVIVLNETLEALNYFNLVVGLCLGVLALTQLGKSHR